MADQEQPRTPLRHYRNTPLHIDEKLSHHELCMLAAMRDPVQVGKARKICEELQREDNDEQKLLEAEDREDAGGSARAGIRDNGSFNEEDADIEEDVDRGRNANTSYTESERINTANTGVGIFTSGLSCGDCGLNGTMPIDEQHQKDIGFAMLKHSKSTYHIRMTANMSHFRIARVKVVPDQAQCPLCDCEEFWTVDSFLDHITEQHPEQLVHSP